MFQELTLLLFAYRSIATTSLEPTTSQEPLMPLVCGQKGFSDTPTTQIVNGQDANECEYSWQAGLRNCGVQYCGGSIITRDWILTAAHCVSQGILDTDVIIVGDYSVSSSDSFQKEHEIERIISHPKYDPSSLQNDFALIKLRTPITFNSCVGPICLPSSDAIQGESCMISGWGTLQSKGSWPDILQEGGVNLLSNSACASSYENASRREIHDSMLCARGTRPDGAIVDACQGDSGGPLACQDKNTNEWILHGLSSWGKNCGDERYPGVYARVWHVLDWVQDEMQSARSESSVPRSCRWEPVEECPCSEGDLAGCDLPACSSCTENGAQCAAYGPLPNRSQEYNINNCFGVSLFTKSCGDTIDARDGTREVAVVNAARLADHKYLLMICLVVIVMVRISTADQL